MTTDTADKIAKLEAEVAELKAKVSPPKSNFVPMSDAEWIDQMHQMRERRMSFASNFHPDDLRAMEAACSTKGGARPRPPRHSPIALDGWHLWSSHRGAPWWRRTIANSWPR